MEQGGTNRIGKMLLIFLGLFPLVSCVDVEDYGDYWQKAGTDKRLAGAWKVLAATPEETREKGYAIGSIWRVVDNNGAYKLSLPGDANVQNDQPIYPIKTLDIGRYQFLLFGRRKGQLFRYKLKGRTLEVCIPDLADFMATHYPNAVNIRKDEEEAAVTTVLRFDNTVFRILSRVPDTEDYWYCDFVKFERIAP
jgi:hypothetical protein